MLLRERHSPTFSHNFLSKLQFLSYAHEDRALVDILAREFGRQGWAVFFDEDIRAGTRWSDEIDQKLKTATCILTLWTANSKDRSFVIYEAALGRAQQKLAQAVFPGCDIPAPFSEDQAVKLLNSETPQADQEGWNRLLRSVAERLGPRSPGVSLPSPNKFEAITDEHLTLVHTSWRRTDKDNEFGGQRMYQIHVILLGQPPALDRVENVFYQLDRAYGDRTPMPKSRAENFGFYELANGYSVVTATVKVRNQNELVRLRRFINLWETGPYLKEFFDKQLDTRSSGSSPADSTTG